MPILWRDAMSVDGGWIDEDHRVLIAIINEFSAVSPGPQTGAELQHILAKLDRYTKTHFAREESLQRSIHYSFHEAHRREHGELIDRLTKVRSELAAVQQKKELVVAHEHISAFLHDWLIDHILQSDLRMKPFAVALREHAQGLKGLPTAAAE